MNPFRRDFSSLSTSSQELSQESLGQIVPKSPSLSELNPCFSPVPSCQSLEHSLSSRNSTPTNQLSPIITRLWSSGQSSSTRNIPVSPDTHVVPTTPSTVLSSSRENPKNDEEDEIEIFEGQPQFQTISKDEREKRIASFNSFPEVGLFDDKIEDIFVIEIDLFDDDNIFA